MRLTILCKRNFRLVKHFIGFVECECVYIENKMIASRIPTDRIIAMSMFHFPIFTLHLIYLMRFSFQLFKTIQCFSQFKIISLSSIYVSANLLLFYWKKKTSFYNSYEFQLSMLNGIYIYLKLCRPQVNNKLIHREKKLYSR